MPAGAILHITTNSTGSLTATGAGEDAGIGGGVRDEWPAVDNAAGEITISGGAVTAIGKFGGAGIGGGTSAAGGTISISCGYVTAEGFTGPGIGAGCGGIMGAIMISGGIVTARCFGRGAGIGSGCDGWGQQRRWGHRDFFQRYGHGNQRRDDSDYRRLSPSTGCWRFIAR